MESVLKPCAEECIRSPNDSPKASVLTVLPDRKAVRDVHNRNFRATRMCRNIVLGRDTSPVRHLLVRHPFARSAKRSSSTLLSRRRRSPHYIASQARLPRGSTPFCLHATVQAATSDPSVGFASLTSMMMMLTLGMMLTSRNSSQRAVNFVVLCHVPFYHTKPGNNAQSQRSVRSHANIYRYIYLSEDSPRAPPMVILLIGSLSPMLTHPLGSGDDDRKPLAAITKHSSAVLVAPSS